jgi:hypothetical protein
MRVFISYHRADTKYKNKIADYLESKNISHYSVPEDYIFDGRHHQDIAQHIIKQMENCTVAICIVGKETYQRPHVDHELKAALKGGICNRKGLVSIMLENRLDNKNKINLDTFPNRIQDNMTHQIQYVLLGQMASFEDEVVELLEAAENKRCDNYNIDNTRRVMNLRAGKYYDQ